MRTTTANPKWCEKSRLIRASALYCLSIILYLCNSIVFIFLLYFYCIVYLYLQFISILFPLHCISQFVYCHSKQCKHSIKVHMGVFKGFPGSTHPPMNLLLL